MTTVVPPDNGPSLGQSAFICGVDRTELLLVELLAEEEVEEDEDDEEDVDVDARVFDESSNGSGRRVRLPCFELLCTNMLSDMANK